MVTTCVESTWSLRPSGAIGTTPPSLPDASPRPNPSSTLTPVRPHAARVASMLVLHGADIAAHRPGTGHGMTALRLDAGCGNLSVVKALLGMGADPSVMDRRGVQAIHAAVQFGHCDVVHYLL